MNARMKLIAQGSIAEELGLQPGDVLLAANENRNLEDLFDYDYEVTQESDVALEVQHPDGSLEIYEIEKDPGDDLGIVFESPLFTPIKTCNNACPFCFIDQQPEGLRPSLYVKDDDYRLSYFNNTYITLTNLTRHDRERMTRIKPGPLYVSVHCTVPEIRAKLLVNPKAAEIMTELRWLASIDIPFHAQLVINPGLNDGEALTHTLKDLASLSDACLSVAIVPVGLTQHRTDLPELRALTQADALDVLDRLEAFQIETGLTDFAFASDEFYVLAQRAIPSYESYADFPQLDDGVGTARHLTQEFFELAEVFPSSITPARRYIAVTGELGAMVLQPIAQRLNQIDGLFLDVVTVKNNFWGKAVTVSGLITGQDMIATLSGQDLSGYTAILIPETMIKSGDVLFLDGLTLSDVESKLGCPIIVVSDPTHASSLIEAIELPLGDEITA